MLSHKLGNSNQILLYGSLVMLVGMLVMRLYQLLLSYSDLHGLINNSSDSSAAVSQLEGNATDLHSQDSNTAILLYFIGNISFFSVMGYFIGLVFKRSDQIHLPIYLSWMISTGMSFCIYTVSTIISCIYAVRLKNKTIHDSFIPINIFILLVLTIISMCSFIFLDNMFFVSILTLFCVEACVLGIALQRLGANYIVKFKSLERQSYWFLFCEIVPDVLIALSGLSAIFFRDEKLTSIFLFAIIVVYNAPYNSDRCYRNKLG